MLTPRQDPYGFFWTINDLIGTSDTVAKAAPGPGLSYYITDVIMDNSGLTPVRGIVKNGTQVVLRANVPGQNNTHFSLGTAIQCDSNTPVNVALAGVGNMTIQVYGYIAP